MNEPIISVSGIRGIFGSSLRPDNVVLFAKAFAGFIKKKRIVLGRDGRIHGDIIEKIIESTLLFSGCEVVNLGVVPTPTVAMAITELKAGGGIAITASHNPQIWNGMKFISSQGIFLDGNEVEELKALINKNDKSYYSWDKVKHAEHYPEFYKRHIAKVLNISGLNINKIRKRKFTVVLDCSNASGSFIVPELLKKLNCTVHKIDCDGSGVFTRKPEPVPENLGKVMNEVKKKKADLGIVVDPDADRLVIITDKGEPYNEENTIVTAIRNILRASSLKKRTAVVNLSTTRAVDDVVKELNGRLFRAPVGEVNVIRKMQEQKAMIGGEGSGGVILPESHFGRDAMTGIAVLLNEFAEAGIKVSEYKKTLPEYHIIKSQIDLSDADPERIIEHLNRNYSREKLNNEDGVRIDFEDSWINFRKSNTEPIMRMIAEAPTMKQAGELVSKFKSELKGLM